MRNLINYITKYRIWADALIVVVLLLGILSAFQIKKRYFPAIDPNLISISVTYPGASPEELEEGVVLKIEEALEGVNGIQEITSTSSENLGRVSVEVKQGYNTDLVLQDVKNAVDQINSFPISAEKPTIFNSRRRSSAMTIVLVGETDLYALKRYAEGVREDLLASSVISLVEISGFPDREISIEVKEETLRRYGLTFDQVASAVRLNNRDISSGSIKSQSEEILIRAKSLRYDVDGIGDIIVRTNDDGSILRLRDLAESEIRFSDTPNKTTFNGKNAVSISINTLEEEDIINAANYVKAYVESFNEANDLVEIVIENDQAVYLKQRLQILIDNGLMGLILVLILLGIFLNLKLSIWVAFGIPFSFLGMVFIANILGVTINIMSLFGMILVIGILVDDGIIVAENIYANFEKGKSVLRSCIDGTLEVLPSVFTGVTTTMVAFSILAFVEGRFGEIVKEMAIVVILCLAFSLIECVFILPPHLAHSGALKKVKKGGFRSRMERGLAYVKDRLYGPLIAWVIRYRYITLALALAFTMVSAGLLSGGYVRFSFFPFIDSDEMTMALVLKPGTREQSTEKILQQIEQKIHQVNEELKAERFDNKDIITNIRIDLGKATNGRSSLATGSHAGQIKMQLLPGEIRNIPSFVLGNKIRKAVGFIPEAEQFTVGGNRFFGSPISISLKSRNLDEIDAATEFVKAELNTYADLKEITDTNIPGRREVNIKLKPKAYLLGLTQNEITRQIRQGFFGEEVQRLQIGKDEVRVWLRYPAADRMSLGGMENIMIKMNDGREFPMRELVDYDIQRGIVSIQHLNGAREIRVDAELAEKNMPSEGILAKISSELIPELQTQYPGVRVSLEGQQRRGNEISSSLAQLIPAALLGIFLIISLAFRSFTQSILILLMMPLGFVGALAGHYLLGATLSIFSVYGMIALAGVIVNDAVVFADKFNRLLRSGHTVVSATFYSGKSRFRPIVLTSLTTIIGLYPLILAKSRQAQFLVPMAISVAYGVLLGTFFILTVFPALLVVTNDIRMLLRWGWRGLWDGVLDKPDRRSVEPTIQERIEVEKIGEDD
ncbi:MAG: efflux RND transporter permease subunit [Bacteroidota bacterium]